MPAEERRGLIQDVPEQLIAQVADDSLTDVGHQEGGGVRAKAFDQVDKQQRGAPFGQVAAGWQDLVDDRLDQRRDGGRAAA